MGIEYEKAWDNLTAEGTAPRYANTLDMIDTVRLLIVELQGNHNGYKPAQALNRHVSNIVEILRSASTEELAEIISSGILRVLKYVLVVEIANPGVELPKLFIRTLEQPNGRGISERSAKILILLGINSES